MGDLPFCFHRKGLSYEWHAEGYAGSALTKTNWAPLTPENHMALAVLCIIGFIAYWVPTLAANSNRHRNRAAIGMLNLFLGWTFIGWVVALLWADTDNCEN
jgi:T4 superinfection immunity protein